MIKYEYNSAIKYFEISPEFIGEGLDAAEGVHTSIRIRLLNGQNEITKKPIEIECLERKPWIEKLSIDEDVKINNKDFFRLQNLSRLKSLNSTAYGPIDYSDFKQLGELVLRAGSDLLGLEDLKNLKGLYLIKWQSEKLSENLKNLASNEVKIRISASKKLENIDSFTGRRI